MLRASPASCSTRGSSAPFPLDICPWPWPCPCPWTWPWPCPCPCPCAPWASGVPPGCQARCGSCCEWGWCCGAAWPPVKEASRLRGGGGDAAGEPRADPRWGGGAGASCGARGHGHGAARVKEALHVKALREREVNRVTRRLRPRASALNPLQGPGPPAMSLDPSAPTQVGPEPHATLGPAAWPSWRLYNELVPFQRTAPSSGASPGPPCQPALGLPACPVAL
jgi:hypothetical protein